MQGKGEYTFPTGTKYVGEFEDGMFHGSGVMHFASGTKYEATWDRGLVMEVRSTNSVMLKTAPIITTDRTHW